MSVIAASDRAWVLYRARQYDRAIAQGRTALEMDPGLQDAVAKHTFGVVFASYLAQKRFTEAQELVNREIRPASDGWAQAYAQAYEAIIQGRLGRRAEAERALSKFEKLDPRDSPGHENTLLGILIAIGPNDEAIAVLQKAFAEHSNIITELKVNPDYDLLRSDPRFEDLLRRAGLAE